MNKKIKDHRNRVKKLGCIVSGRIDVTLHHAKSGSISQMGVLKGTGLKTSPYLVIPLNAEYHTGRFGIDSGMGVLTWEERFGTQVKYLDEVSRLLGYSVWELAGVERK